MQVASSLLKHEMPHPFIFTTSTQDRCLKINISFDGHYGNFYNVQNTDNFICILTTGFLLNTLPNYVGLQDS